MPDDVEISMKRVRAFNDKVEELKKKGKSAAEAYQGASKHLAELEDTKPNEYLRAKNRKLRKKAMKREEKERKAREQAEGEGEGESANGGSERRGSAGGRGSSGGHGR
jgi:uncharacterized membrane protein YgcG